MQILTTESSIDLLEIIGWKDPSDRKDRDASFAIFYERHKVSLAKAAMQMVKGLRDADTVVKSLVNDTFIDVYHKSSEFNFSKSNCNDPEKAVRLWLIGILKNRFLQHIDEAKKRNPERYALETHFLQTEQPRQTIENFDLNLNSIAVQSALDMLPENDKELLLISMNFMEIVTDDSKKSIHCEIPPDIRKALALAFGVQEISLRKKRERALAKLKTILEKNRC